MKRKWTVASVLGVALLLFLAVGLSQAQGPEPPGEGVVPQEMGIEALVDDAIPIQGRLTDASGNPLNGNYSITASIYNVSSGGTALCSDTDTVAVNNGLFTMYVNSCTSAIINGQQLYLGIKVGTDAEMTPRQGIYPVPYAWGLRPGAIISNTASSGHGLEVWSAAGGGASGTALWVVNTSTGSGIALWARVNGTDAAIIASNNGTGLLFKGFGADGGEDEFRVANNGAISTKADSYIFVPGTEAKLNATSSGASLEYYGVSQVVVNPSTTGTKVIQFGVVLPSVLYGQPVKVEEVTVFYSTNHSASYIAATYVYRQKASDPLGYYTLVSDTTNRNSTAYGSYSVTPTADNLLSIDEGFISVRLDLSFANADHEITIGGIRVRLGHHPLY
ncbi:MAG: hypothetical protein N2508_08185 [Anaerolineae bacterium]|nr:hypothetical protein [Anaerolineae bacterium]